MKTFLVIHAADFKLLEFYFKPTIIIQGEFIYGPVHGISLLMETASSKCSGEYAQTHQTLHCLHI